MKTTVKISATRSIIIQPAQGGVSLQSVFVNPTGEVICNLLAVLTPDQAGALIFAIEQACEANEISAARG